MKTIKLIDDGTLDTVISVNGKEYRFNQDYESEMNYDEWIEWCIDEAVEAWESEEEESK
jgi:hypothetical protein